MDAKQKFNTEAAEIAEASQALPPLMDDYDFEERHVCERCVGDGFIEYNDGDGGDWGEDCPSEENHLIVCRACRGTGEAQ